MKTKLLVKFHLGSGHLVNLNIISILKILKINMKQIQHRLSGLILINDVLFVSTTIKQVRNELIINQSQSLCVKICVKGSEGLS